MKAGEYLSEEHMLVKLLATINIRFSVTWTTLREGCLVPLDGVWNILCYRQYKCSPGDRAFIGADVSRATTCLRTAPILATEYG